MGQTPPLYSRIGYDALREAEAFRRLAEFDLAASRRAFTALLDSLQPAETAPDSQRVAQLLLDVLQRVNHQIHGSDGPTYQANRVALIEQFAGCRGAEQARRRFSRALDRLLGPLEPERPSPHPLIQRAKHYIDEHYDRRISLSSVSTALCISPNYLSRLFRRETGMTLTAYIQRVRLRSARLMLADGAYSISEIAFRVGYQNYRDFYRNFVKYEKTSPRQLQRSLRAERATPPSAS